jgi:hypothetical protein
MIRRSSIFVCAFLLSACAATPSAEQRARLAEANRTVPTCSTEKECTAKWEAAQLWVVKNAGYKIQTVTSVLIETFNATGSNVHIAVRVTKEPMGGGKYRFLARVWCDNMFGCKPDTYDALLDFNNTLNAVQP